MSDKTRNDVLRSILEVARVTSEPGGGKSIADALQRSGFVEHRASLTPADFKPLLEEDSGIAESWCQFSEDKRTSGGWYILQDSFEIGSLEDESTRMQFDSLAEAVAAYVVAELDFWASVNAD